LRDWVIRFNEQGPDGLINIPSPGAPPKLDDMHRIVDEGPIPAVHGVVRCGGKGAVPLSVPQQKLGRRQRAHRGSHCIGPWRSGETPGTGRSRAERTAAASYRRSYPAAAGVLNLITNAVDSMTAEDGPRVLRVRSDHRDDGYVLVSIGDTGAGIREHDVDRILNPLFTTKSDGMGMGLSICRSIIEAHHGRLWVAPNKPKGSVFQFILLADRMTVASSV